MSDERARSWAILTARLMLGFMFFMTGVTKVFSMGPTEHARQLFVEPYADTFLPAWSLWATGTAIPIVELVGGGLLLLGLFTRPALLSLAAVLVTVTFGHLLAEPFFQFHGHVLPRVVLLLFVLSMPAAMDTLGLDHWWRRSQTRGHDG